jgi:hypothetical protein
MGKSTLRRILKSGNGYYTLFCRCESRAGGKSVQWTGDSPDLASPGSSCRDAGPANGAGLRTPGAVTGLPRRAGRSPAPFAHTLAAPLPRKPATPGMELLASIGAAAEPVPVPDGSKGASGAGEAAGAGRRSRTAGAGMQPAEHTAVHGGDEARGMLEAEAAAVATLAAGAVGPTRKRGERPPNEFLLQRAVDTSDVSVAEATALAALAHNGRDSARKRARQLDFGRNSPASAVFAQAYPMKRPHEDDDDEQPPLSPSSAAGTLLGFVGAAAQAQFYGEAGGPSTPSKRKACNCKNSKCLKLYCECFASGSYCSVSCNCQGCQNNEHFQSQRKSAIDATLERNPMAFRPKIAASASLEQSSPTPLAHGRHTKGCHCKKSGCLKKYCECFQAGVLCAAQCKCHDCKNTEESVERKALLTSGGWGAATPHERASRDRAGTPSPTDASRSRQLDSPFGARGFPVRTGQRDGLSALMEPGSSADGQILSSLIGGAGSMGPAIALQVQETMMNMRLAHKDCSTCSHMSSSLIGLPQEREAKLAERTAVRNHLNDPMLFNLCRVLLLSAKKVADVDSSAEDEKLAPGASSARSLPPPALAPVPDAAARRKQRGCKEDGEDDGAATSANGKHAQGTQVEGLAEDGKDTRMQRAVLLELRHYLGQMQAIVEARPSTAKSAVSSSHRQSNGHGSCAGRGAGGGEVAAGKVLPPADGVP